MDARVQKLMSGAEIRTLPLAPSLDVQLTDGPVGVVVRNVDLSEELDGDVIFSLLTLLNNSGVMIIKDQINLTPQRQLDFTQCFGPPFMRGVQADSIDKLPAVEKLQVQMLSNRDMKAKDVKPVDDPSGAATQPLAIHSDVQDYVAPPDFTVLHGMIVPPPSAGGNTYFCNLNMAYEALSDEMKARLEGAKWRPYSTYMTMKKVRQAAALADDTPDIKSEVRHPVVRTHPVTGCKALWISSFTEEVIGDWSVEEGEELARELFRFAAQDRFWYTHIWSPHDVVFWDNRCVNHRRDTWDSSYVREMHRSQAGSSRPF